MEVQTRTTMANRLCRYKETKKIYLGDDLDLYVQVVNIHDIIVGKIICFGPAAKGKLR